MIPAFAAAELCLLFCCMGIVVLLGTHQYLGKVWIEFASMHK